jgi:hypothetical protein
MAATNLPSPEELRQYMTYDPETGILTWLSRPLSDFQGKGGCHTAETRWKIWNTTCSGKEALNSTRYEGYKVGTIFGTLARAHRVAWALHYGHWPVGEIDHIDGNPANNAIANLRDVDRTGNARNLKRNATNTSGCGGVSFDIRRGQWKAYIWVDGSQRFLGRFDSKFDAILHRLIAEKGRGYTMRHGVAA